MARRFSIPDPETLLRMEHLVKSGNLSNFAKVWSAARRSGGKTIWDGRIGVRFGPDGNGRRAMIYRIAPNGDWHQIAQLKYNPALEWCRVFLKPITEEGE